MLFSLSNRRHPLYKLGKRRVRQDKRNFQLRALIANRLKVPSEYSFDVVHPGIPLKMYANDRAGCCVISARASQTVRFELLEQKKVISITDKEVLNQYFKETGGSDVGLYLLDSLNAWRSGWKAGGKTYKIKAFAQVDPKSRDNIKQALFAEVGLACGISLPLSSRKEFDSGKAWSTTSGKGSEPGSWGGHCVLVVGYTSIGPVCLTWAQRQQMTWGFFAKYCDEAYVVIDAFNTAKKRKLFNRKKIEELLKLSA